MPRLLLINYEYPPVGAGAAHATAQLAASFFAQGYDVHIVTSSFGRLCGYCVERGIAVHRIPSLRRHKEKSSLVEMGVFILSALTCLPRIANKIKPDHVLVFFALPCGLLGLSLRLLLRIPYTVSLRGGDVPGAEPSLHLLHRLLTPVRRAVLKNSLLIVANSQGLKDLALSTDPKVNILVIPNGIDSDFYSPSPTLRNVAFFTFLFVGRLQPQKNVGVLLTAFQECFLVNKAIRLIICGDGPLKPRLMLQAEQIGIAAAVSWHGWQSREAVRQEYRNADCFVNPSLYEGMPNTVLEAMSCALPVLAGRCIGNTDVIKPGVNGFLFDPQNSSDLAYHMNVLIKNPRLCRDLGKAGRELCLSTYSWDRSGRAYLDKMFPSGGLR